MKYLVGSSMSISRVIERNKAKCPSTLTRDGVPPCGTYGLGQEGKEVPLRTGWMDLPAAVGGGSMADAAKSSVLASRTRLP